MKYEDYHTIETAQALTTRLVSTASNNLKSALVLIPFMCLATWIGWDALHAPEIPNYMRWVWWGLFGWNLGWVMAMWGMVGIARFYSANAEVCDAQRSHD